MRGARSFAAENWNMPGIIPADAGSTLVRRSDVPKCRDHPRGCGEHDSERLRK